MDRLIIAFAVLCATCVSLQADGIYRLRGQQPHAVIHQSRIILYVPALRYRQVQPFNGYARLSEDHGKRIRIERKRRNVAGYN